MMEGFSFSERTSGGENVESPMRIIAVVFTSTKRSKFKKLTQRCSFHSGTRAVIRESLPQTISECDGITIIQQKKMLSDSELERLSNFIYQNASVIIFGTEWVDKKDAHKLNKLLCNFGISVQNESVIRLAYHKYHHPKEVCISDGILHPNLYHANDNISLQHKGECASCRSFVYPKGVTINSISPSIALLSTGSVAYPTRRPVAAAWESDATNVLAVNARILVIGSSDMFSDNWIEKEGNMAVCDVLIKFLLTNPGSSFRQSSAICHGHIEEVRCIPDVRGLANKMKPCILAGRDLPQDYRRLFSNDVFGYNADMIPKVGNAYEKLNVRREPLQLAKPVFILPVQRLKPATFDPRMPETPAPSLELFDLDTAFANDQDKLARLTNKCSEDIDIENYISELRVLLGGNKIGHSSSNGKSTLDSIFKMVTCFKSNP